MNTELEQKSTPSTKVGKRYNLFTLPFAVGVLGCAGVILIIIAAAIPLPGWLSVVFSSIGTTLLTIFVVSVIHESKSLSDYFTSRITDVIVGEDYLHKLNEDSLKALRSRANKALAQRSSVESDNDFINVMQNEIDSFMISCYIVKQKIDVVLKEDPNRKDHYRKIVHREIQYMNPTGKPYTIKYLPTVRMKSIKGAGNEELFSIIDFKILEDNEAKLHCSDLVFDANAAASATSLYDIKISCPKTHTFLKRCTVICETSRLISKDDRSYTHRVNLPHKELEATYHYTGANDIRLAGSGFCNNYKEKVSVNLTHENRRLTISMKECILPGDGIVIHFHELIS